MSVNLAAVLRNAGLDDGAGVPAAPGRTTSSDVIGAHLLALVRALTTTFLNECHGPISAQLKTLLFMLADDAARHAGKTPADETAGIRCRHCGPVFTHPAWRPCRQQWTAGLWRWVAHGVLSVTRRSHDRLGRGSRSPRAELVSVTQSYRDRTGR